MTKEKIIKRYIADLNNLVADSDAKINKTIIMKTEHLDLEIKNLTHSQNYEGLTETGKKRLAEFIEIKQQLALCGVSQQREVFDAKKMKNLLIIVGKAKQKK